MLKLLVSCERAIIILLTSFFCCVVNFISCFCFLLLSTIQIKLTLLLLLFFLICRRQLENKMVDNHQDMSNVTIRNRGCYRKGCDHETFSL